MTEAPESLPTAIVQWVSTDEIPDVGPVSPLDGTDSVDAARERIRSELFEWTTTKIGRFTVLERIGDGGMAVVYAAYDPQLDRKIAIKVLRRSSSTLTRGRLIREARALAKLQHPNVLQVFEVLERDEDLALAMEFVQGEDLQAYFERDPPWRDVVRVMLDAARGLAAAHQRGLVHRDFKPHNVLLDQQGRARVADFGLARLDTEPVADSTAVTPTEFESHTRLTRSGTLMGTPAYMAPELFEGAPADERSDQFALCATMYRGLYRRLPFMGDSLPDLAAAIAKGIPAEPSTPVAVPRAVRAVVLRGLSPEPSDRFPTVAALLAALERAARPRRWVVPAAGLIAMVGLSSALWPRSPALDPPPAPCADAAASLVDVFDHARRERIEHAFIEADPATGAQAWQRVQARLGSHVNAAATQRIDACRATRVEGTQSESLLDRRIHCVDGKVGQLRALLRRFESPDVQVVRAAARATSGLGSMQACADIDRLLAEYEPPPPHLVTEVDEIRAGLDELRAAFLVGEIQSEHARSLLADHAQLDYPPIQAELQLELARHLTKDKALDDAILHAQAGFWSAIEGHHDEAAVDGAIVLTMLHANHKRVEDGLSWSRTAEVLTRRRGDRGEQLARVLGARGGALRRADQFELADEALSQALEIFEQAGSSAVVVSEFAREHAAVAYRRGQFEEAYARAERALALAQQGYGPQHPETASAYNSLAITLRGVGRPRQAADAFQHASDIHGVVGPDSGRALQVELNLAVMHSVLGEPEQAVQRMEPLLPRIERVFGPLSEDYSDALAAHASFLANAERFEESITFTRRALAIIRSTVGEQGSDYAVALHNLSSSLSAAGRHEQAVDIARRALGVFEQVFGAEHPRVATALANVGVCESRLGHHSAAVHALARSVAMHEALKSPPDLLCPAAGNHAAMLERAGRQAAAQAVDDRFAATCPTGEDATTSAP